jgi:hypothetical protein
MHLAVVDSSGNVLVGESREPKVSLQTTGVRAKAVQWAGRQLAAHGINDDVHLVTLRDDGTPEPPVSAGRARAFRLNQEGQMVVDRGSGLALINSTREKVLGAEAQLSAPNALDAFALSSIRPKHTRRPMPATSH